MNDISMPNGTRGARDTIPAPAPPNFYEPRAPYCKGATKFVNKAMVKVQHLLSFCDAVPVEPKELEAVAADLRNAFAELETLERMVRSDDRKAESGKHRRARRMGR